MKIPELNADQIIFFFYINFFFTLPSQILLNKKKWKLYREKNPYRFTPTVLN